MLLEPWILLALVLVGLARWWRASYRTWLALLIASLGLAYAGVYLAEKNAPSHAAAAYSAAAAARLDARPWPTTNVELLALIASYRAFDRFEAVVPLESLYAIGQMHQVLGDPPPSYDSARAAIAANAARLQRENRRQNRGEETQILLERVVQTFLHVSLPDAAPNWPTNLPAPPAGPNFRYLGDGAWLALRSESWGTEADTVFPLRVTNDGPGPVSDAQGSVLFYDPTAPSSPSGRPREIFSCFGLAIDRLAPGESRFFKCQFISSMYVFRTTEAKLEQLRRLRGGVLHGWVRPNFFKYVLWDPTNAVPLSADEVARYVRLKDQDRRYGRMAERIRSGMVAWLAIGSILLAGFVIPGISSRLLEGARVRSVSIVSGLVALLVGPAILIGGVSAHDWAPLAYALFAVAGAGAFITGLVLGNILLAKAAAR